MNNKSFEEIRAEYDRVTNEIISVFVKHNTSVWDAERILQEIPDIIKCTSIVATR